MKKLFKRLVSGEEKLMSDNKTLERREEEKSLSTNNTPKRLKFAEEKPTSDNNAPQIKYDVFVSFRGEIRRELLSHLVDRFTNKNINAFIDNKLKSGDNIWPSLVGAIEGSSILLIIFSPNYASSHWCLEELVTIHKCKEKYGRVVIPVFYKIEPKQVRHQSSQKYKNAFAKHGRKYKSKVPLWRDALNKSAHLSGIESSKFQNDAELLEEIVNRVQVVLRSLDKSQGSISKGFAGFDEKVAYVESLIRREPDHTRLIGIWGMGGIGKTTLAEKVFTKLRSEYDGYYFLENEGEKYNKHLKIIFSKLLGNDVEIDTPNSLPDDFVRRSHDKKVFVVLDGMNDSELIEKLLGILDNFGSGSRIIVTTRDKHVLNKAHEIYQLEEFSFDEALELFNLNAFKQSDHQKEYHELSKRMVSYAKGIPLVLKVLACRLCGKNKEVWKSELDKLEKMPPSKVYDVMKLSYDDLDRKEQKIFLDLSCFVLRLHEKVKVHNLKHLLKDDERDNSVVAGLERLKDKALITFSEDNFICMHDSLQEMGWEIVRRQSTKDPGSYTWLWELDDMCQALENDKDTKAIRSIQIDLSKIKEKKLSPDIFTKMSRLKFLEVYGGSYEQNTLAKGLQFLATELRFFCWYHCSLKSLPENFSVEKLVILKLPFGRMQKLWDGVKNLVNLKELDLNNSKKLKELPDLSKATNLEELLLGSCSMLTRVHPSIFSLRKLEKLDLFNCKSLSILASDSHLRRLSYLNLDLCRGLTEFSLVSENMKELRLQETKVKTLPSSFGQQSKLKLLHLRGSYIEKLPSSFNNFTQLLHLELTNCSKLQIIEDLPPFLETLDIKYCRSLQTLPKLPLSLETLNVRSCKSLQILPELPSSLKIKTLNAISCHSLQRLPALPPSLKTLNVESCESLERLPNLPVSLETLDVHCCPSLQTLPNLPESLKTLDVHWCSKLETLPELLQSHKTLDISLCTSLKILPDLPSSLEILDAQSCSSLLKLPTLPAFLKTLDVHRCSSLETLPNLPTSLETLNVHWCSKLKTLPNFPTSLKTLDARHCYSLEILSELPQSLETLDVKGCTLLHTLPDLSLNLKTLDASDCKSLETILLFPSTTIGKLRENMTRVLLWNCLKLDEHSLLAIESNAKDNVMKFATLHLSTSTHHQVENYNDYDVNNNHSSYQAIYVYPGSNIPVWLEYRSTEDYIIIDLSSNPPCPLVGFIFCFILCEDEVKKDSVKGRLEVHITVGDCEGEGKHDNVRKYIDFEGSKIESEHVCVVYDQRCSSILNSRAKSQTKFKIQVTMGPPDYASPRRGARFGVSMVKHFGLQEFCSMELCDSV